MRKTSLSLAIAASVAAFSPVIHAADAPLAATSAAFSASATAAGITFNFSGLSLAGFQFSQLAGGVAGPVYGTLTSVSVNATLNASVDYTYADDLTLYVDPLPLSSGGLLQVGGFSNLAALERHAWANGASSEPGTTVIDTVTLTTPLTFTGGASDAAIWLGNGYGAAGTSGTWSGSITLNGLSVTPVPEPSTNALLALGGLGMAAWLARRRRPANA